jgi:hypothetical protein
MTTAPTNAEPMKVSLWLENPELLELTPCDRTEANTNVVEDVLFSAGIPTYRDDNDYLSTHSRLTTAVRRALERAGVETTYEDNTVFLFSVAIHYKDTGSRCTTVKIDAHSAAEARERAMFAFTHKKTRPGARVTTKEFCPAEYNTGAVTNETEFENHAVTNLCNEGCPICIIRDGGDWTA